MELLLTCLFGYCSSAEQGATSMCLFGVRRSAEQRVIFPNVFVWGLQDGRAESYFSNELFWGLQDGRAGSYYFFYAYVSRKVCRAGTISHMCLFQEWRSVRKLLFTCLGNAGRLGSYFYWFEEWRPVQQETTSPTCLFTNFSAPLVQSFIGWLNDIRN